jgi:hypothetical protein
MGFQPSSRFLLPMLCLQVDDMDPGRFCSRGKYVAWNGGALPLKNTFVPSRIEGLSSRGRDPSRTLEAEGDDHDAWDSAYLL